MGISKNILDRSDISTQPIKLKYSASYVSESAINYGITLNRGINGSFDSNGEEFLVYRLAKQLYYNLYLTGSVNNTSSYWDDNLQSTAASGTFDNDYRYYPTSSGDQITILAMPRNVFGGNISRKSVTISGTTYNLIDDGNGNIIDTNNNNVHVGNILYNQGIIVVTNLDYEYALIPDCVLDGICTLPATTTTTTTSTTTTTTTLPPGVYAFVMKYSATSGTDACNQTTSATYYSNSATLNAFSVLAIDPSLSTAAPAGYYCLAIGCPNALNIRWIQVGGFGSIGGAAFC